LASELSVLFDELISFGSIDDSELVDDLRSILVEAEIFKERNK
jgi:hypothetical protein